MYVQFLNLDTDHIISGKDWVIAPIVFCQKQAQNRLRHHLDERFYWTNGTKVMAVQRCFI